MSRVATGLELVGSGIERLPDGQRIGLICNPTSITGDFVHAIDVIGGCGCRLAALFGPEHGIRGDAQDMIGVGNNHDLRTGLPVWSLYGSDIASLTPPLESLDELDALVFDIQDVGARYYTYVWTMVLAMRACAVRGKAFIVLDRPNPISGASVEGGEITAGFDSFVGLISVANRHGLTAGEVARLVAAEEQLDLELRIIEMRGWSRSMYFDETGLPWVMPSPNMPTLDTALVYPGLCLIEGTELSEGRGTTRPFEIIGAPYIDGSDLANELESSALDGVAFRPLGFLPTFQKHANKACGGVQIHVTDRRIFRPYRTAVAILWAIHRLYPDEFEWRHRAYEFVEDIPAVDLLAGSDELRLGIEAGASVGDLESTWLDGLERYEERRATALMYR